MKKSIALWNYGRDQLANARLFHKAGFEALSFLGRYFDENSPEEDADTAACVRALHTPMTIHHRLPNPDCAAETAAFFRNMEHIRRWQETYGLLTGLTFDCNFPLSVLAPILDRVLDLFAFSGVFLACEDHPLNAEEAALFPRLDRPGVTFGLLLDAGHMNVRLNGDEGALADQVAQQMAQLPLPVMEIHLSGNFGAKDEHLAPEEGNFPMGAFVQGLKCMGFDGFATVERVPRDEDVAFSRQKAVRSMAWFADQWGNNGK